MSQETHLSTEFLYSITLLFSCCGWITILYLCNLKMYGVHAPGDRVPEGGVPGQEPAHEGGRFMALFHHHHRSPLVPAARVSLYVLFGCRGDEESLLRRSKQLHLAGIAKKSVSHVNSDLKWQ